jgi:hypothetical protein
MKALYLSFWCALAGATLGCIGNLPDELPYGCETEADCGGDDYVCTVLPDSRRYCCLPEPETCNRVDDDCNGKVDDGLTGSCSN